jgi:tRNA 2-thiouridine synthesizing protein A
MDDMRIVDASGLSCPQPVLLTRQALRDGGSGRIAVLVDTGTSRDNVRRLAEREGCHVDVEERPEGGYRLVLSR